MYYFVNKYEENFVSIIIWEILFNRYDVINIYICLFLFLYSNLSLYIIVVLGGGVMRGGGSRREKVIEFG